MLITAGQDCSLFLWHFVFCGWWLVCVFVCVCACVCVFVSVHCFILYLWIVSSVSLLLACASVDVSPTLHQALGPQGGEYKGSAGCTYIIYTTISLIFVRAICSLGHWFCCPRWPLSLDSGNFKKQYWLKYPAKTCKIDSSVSDCVCCRITCNL